MPPHNYISMFKEKNKKLHGRLDSSKPNPLKLLLLSITTTALNLLKHTYLENCANLQKPHPLLVWVDSQQQQPPPSKLALIS